MTASRAQHNLRASVLWRARQQRGIALVEGVIVGALLVSLLALGGAVHRRQVRDLTATRAARLLSWRMALEGCQQRTEYAGWIEPLLRRHTLTPWERSVIHTPIRSAGARDSAEAKLPADVADAARAPCNELPRNDDGGLSALDTYLEQRLFPPNP
jgi:hypothetical protein